MDKELQNFIIGAKNIRMTPEERSLLYSKLSSLPIPSPAKIIKSPYLAKSHFWTLGKALIAACLIAVLGGGGLSYAAENSLPGDLLYPVKTNINEEIVSAIQFKQEAKIAWQEKMVERRLKELEDLKQKGKLNDKTKIQFEKHLERNLSNVSELKNKYNKIENSEIIIRAEKIKSDFKKEKEKNREESKKEEREKISRFNQQQNTPL